MHQRSGLRLDGDAALALQVHRGKHLAVHLAFGQPPQALDQPIGQRGLAMVDVGDDGKVANVLHTGAMGVGKEGYCSGSRGLHVQWKHLLRRMSVQRQ